MEAWFTELFWDASLPQKTVEKKISSVLKNTVMKTIK